MNMQFYRDSISHHGIGSTLYHAAYRAANNVTQVAVWNAMTIRLDRVDERLLADPRRARGRMLDAAAMRLYVEEPDIPLTHPFIDEAIVKGDRCYAMFADDGSLTSYAWYSTRPTRLTEIARKPRYDGSFALDAPAPVIHFDPSYAYMYNGFTHPRHRGQGLYAVGMAVAVEECTKGGLRGIVAYVDSSNFASLKSCRRVGYEIFGHVIMVRVGTRYVFRSTSGCSKYDFRVEAAAS